MLWEDRAPRGGHRLQMLIGSSLASILDAGNLSSKDGVQQPGCVSLPICRALIRPGTRVFTSVTFSERRLRASPEGQGSRFP